MRGMCSELIRRGLRAEVAMIARSGGVYQILSVGAALRRHLMRVTYFVAIAGHDHPTIYKLAEPMFMQDGTCIIVHHHPADKLCPWPPVQQFWTALKLAMFESGRGAYIFTHWIV